MIRSPRDGKRRWCSVVAAVGVAACVRAPVLPQTPFDPYDPPRAIEIAAASTVAEVELRGVPAGKASGAARGGLGAAGQCLALVASGDCSGAMCGAFLLAALGLCAAAGLGGAIYGGITAESSAAVERLLAELEAAARENAMQQRLADAVAVRARNEGFPVPEDPARAGGFRIETALLEVALEGSTGSLDPDLALALSARASLVRTRDGARLADRDYRLRIGDHKLRQWLEGGGARLLPALDEAYRRLGAHIFDQLVLLHPLPGRSPASAGPLAAAFGLAPLHPRFFGAAPSGAPLLGALFGEWPEVGRQPTLRWESFPREQDRREAPGDMGRVQHVRYDLAISRAQSLGSGPLAYARERLASPEHRLEQPLAAGRYFWTVRARFELDGRERVSEWAATSGTARDPGEAVPNAFSYRFAVRR